MKALSFGQVQMQCCTNTVNDNIKGEKGQVLNLLFFNQEGLL